MEGATRPIRLHGIIKTAEGRLARIALMADPMNSEADAESPEHGEIPSGVEGANPAFVFQGDDVEPLVEAVLDAPVAALVVEQRGGIVTAWVMGGQQEELFERGRRLAGIVDRLL